MKGSRSKRRQTLDAPWRRRHPALSAALRLAHARYGRLPGILGLGIGRARRETDRTYDETSSGLHGGGLAVNIFVAAKRPDATLEPAARIPRQLWVKVPNGLRRRKVRIDVVTVGEGELQLALAAPSYRHSVPTAGAVSVGRLFSFDRTQPATSAQGTHSGPDLSIGTTGAILRRSDGVHFAISAGHAFMAVEAGRFAAPPGHRRFGLLELDWRALTAPAFSPANILHLGSVCDSIGFRFPDTWLPPLGAGWPAQFDRKLADQADINSAVAAQDTTGAVWVERGNSSTLLGLDLLGIAGPLVIGTCPAPYADLWRYRFVGPLGSTVRGDSGSAVFIRSASDPRRLRLLGFHVYRSPLDEGYAVDARRVLQRVFNRPVPDPALSFA